MRTVELKLYSFEELSEKAQNKAIDWWLSRAEYPWSNDNRSVIEEFARIFGLSRLDWSYGGCGKYVSFSTNDLPDGVCDLKGSRLMAYIWNNVKMHIWKGKYRSGKTPFEYRDQPWPHHRMQRQRQIGSGPNKGQWSRSFRSNIILESDCPLTGFYLDYSILDPIYKLWDEFDPNKTFHDLMTECLSSWLDAAHKAFEYYYSEENAREEILTNEYEFTEDGEIY